MKNSKKFLLSFAFLFIFSVLTTSCNDDDSSSDNTSGTSTLKVSLTDAPGDYDEVNIEVIDVKIKNSDDTDDENGWVSVGNVTPKIYNLLELTGGLTALLTEDQIPSGYVGQIRLVLGDENTVVVDGVSHELDTPSGQQSGLKLQVKETLMPDKTYNFLLDFDVDKSIVSAGNSGKYILKPVIRVITEEVPTGSITGTVAPLGFQVAASVDVNGTAVSAYTDENGVFVLHGIPVGTYTVTLTPDVASGFTPKTIENVVVVSEETIDTGTTNFAVTGSITGTVAPLGFQVTASVDVNGLPVSANTNAAGVFVLPGIPAGTYTVKLTPDPLSSYTPKTIENVVVVNGETTDTGTTNFP